MYVSLKWVEQVFGVKNISLNSFIERLVLAGFEVESVERKQSRTNSDIIIDISFTANRADISNLKGFTIELFSLFKTDILFQVPLKLKPLFLQSKEKKQKNLSLLQFNPSKKENALFLLKYVNINFVDEVKSLLINSYYWENYFQKKVFNTFLFNKVFKDSSQNYIPIFQNRSNKIKVVESPLWIKKRLAVMEFKSINNVIDTLNYILIETGQVFFAYDINGLKNFTKTMDFNFDIRLANQTDNLNMSKSETFKLTNNILTLSNNNKIISIFGVVQDFNTIVTKTTSQFLLETSIYNGNEVKKISKILGLRTEYSIKLEKQIDLNLLEQAYFRLLYLFKVQGIYFEETLYTKSDCLIKNSSKLILNYLKNSKNKIKVFYNNINQLIGSSKKYLTLKNIDFLKCLKTLNFKISYRTDKNFIVSVPFQRQYDIEQEADIIEEIVRVLGFNYFPSQLPIQNRLGKLTKLEKFKRRLRNYLINLGFNESLHSIFSKKVTNSEPLLQNPLLNHSSSLRGSLLKNLLEKVNFNQTNVRENFEVFEFGRIYQYTNQYCDKKEELEVISGIFGGELFCSAWEQTTSTINWFEAKGLLENIFRNLDISMDWIPAHYKAQTIFHPLRTVNLFFNSQIIGTFGQIHPHLALRVGLNKSLYLFEFNVQILADYWNPKTAIDYLPYSSYPILYVDLTCITKKTLSFNIIKEKILEVGQPLLKSIELFDYYCHHPIKEDYCSLTFKLGFNSSTRTLLSSEINILIDKVSYSLEKNFEVEFHK